MCFKYFSLSSLRAPLGSNCRTTGLPSASGKCAWNIIPFSGRGRMFGFLPNKIGSCWGHLYHGKKGAAEIIMELSVPVITTVTLSPLCPSSLPLFGRDTVHACHCTHRGQRTTLGIRAHLPLCLIQGLMFTAAYTRLGSPVPAPYRHVRSILPWFKWVWGIRTRVLRLCGTLPGFASFLRHSPLYSPSCPKAPNPPPPTS